LAQTVAKFEMAIGCFKNFDHGGVRLIASGQVKHDRDRVPMDRYVVSSNGVSARAEPAVLSEGGAGLSQPTRVM